MLAKWVIVAFMSVSALFTSNLRAAESKLDDLISSSKTTESMRASLLAVHQNLGVDLDISEWILKEEPKKIERALKYLSSAEFYKLYPLILEKCDLKINSFHLGTSLFVSGDALYLDAFDPALSSHLAQIPARCEKVSASVNQLNDGVAPRTVTVDKDRVLSGRVDSLALARWVTAVKSTKFLTALDEYDRECRQVVKQVRFDFFDGYSRVTNEQTLNLEVSPAISTKRLFAAAAACRKILPALAEFSTSLAIAHGLIFSTDIGQIYDKRIRVSNIQGWIDFYRNDPRRLDAFRALVVKSSKTWDYSDIKKCQLDTTQTPADCNHKLIGVSLTTFTSISDFSPAAMLFIFMGNPVITAIAAIDSMSRGSGVTIDATEAPHSIKTIK